MDRANRTSELAALLDGEIKDHELAEALHAWVGQDPSFQAEFDGQREVKTLLSRLPEYEAPPYLATRVLGAINARQRRRFSTSWRVWATAIGGFLLTLSAAGLWPTAQTMWVAQKPAAPSHPVQLGVSINPDDLYKSQDWAIEPYSLAGRQVDPQLADYLRFTSEAHNYARAMYAADEVSPDLPAAVLVLDTQGGGH